MTKMTLSLCYNNDVMYNYDLLWLLLRNFNCGPMWHCSLA